MLLLLVNFAKKTTIKPSEDRGKRSNLDIPNCNKTVPLKHTYKDSPDRAGFAQ